MFLLDRPTDSCFWISGFSVDSVLTECDFQRSNDSKTGKNIYIQVLLYLNCHYINFVSRWAQITSWRGMDVFVARFRSPHLQATTLLWVVKTGVGSWKSGHSRYCPKYHPSTNLDKQVSSSYFSKRCYPISLHCAHYEHADWIVIWAHHWNMCGTPVNM